MSNSIIDWGNVLGYSVDKTLNTTTASTDSPLANTTAQELLMKMETARKMMDALPMYANADQYLSVFLDEETRNNAIEEANRITALKWEKKFNKLVLGYVKEAIESGWVKVVLLPAEETLTWDVSGKVSDHAVKYETVLIEYDGNYATLRSDVEKAVRKALRPPIFKEPYRHGST